MTRTLPTSRRVRDHGNSRCALRLFSRSTRARIMAGVFAISIRASPGVPLRRLWPHLVAGVLGQQRQQVVQLPLIGEGCLLVEDSSTA